MIRLRSQMTGVGSEKFGLGEVDLDLDLDLDFGSQFGNCKKEGSETKSEGCFPGLPCSLFIFLDYQPRSLLSNVIRKISLGWRGGREGGGKGGRGGVALAFTYHNGKGQKTKVKREE